MLYMCIEYHIYVNTYHVSAQGVDERMINVHYYYYYAHIKQQQPKAGKARKQIPDQQIYQSPTNVRTKENIAVHSTVS